MTFSRFDAAACLDVLKLYTGCVQLDGKQPSSLDVSAKACMETFDIALSQQLCAVASCSLAQTKNLERDYRLFTTWTLILLISL